MFKITYTEEVEDFLKGCLNIENEYISKIKIETGKDVSLESKQIIEFLEYHIENIEKYKK